MRPVFNFHFISTILFINSTGSAGGGGVLPDFLFSFSFSCSADKERDWPPYCIKYCFRVGNQYAEYEEQLFVQPLFPSKRFDKFSPGFGGYCTQRV